MEILTVVSLVLAVVYLVVILLTWNSKDVNTQLLIVILTLSLLIVNVIDSNVPLSILWGVNLLLGLIGLSRHSNKGK